jgi:hypothetical protein
MSQSSTYSEERAQAALKGLQEKFSELRKEKCGADIECKKQNIFYDWQNFIPAAKAKGLPAIRRQAERAVR